MKCSENNVVQYHDGMIVKLRSLDFDQGNFYREMLAQTDQGLVSLAIVSKQPLSYRTISGSNKLFFPLLL